MASNSSFFASRNPQAVLKHGVLTRYAYYFSGRAGRATQGRVAFIDGYAGEGRYEDGSPGSPLLLASEAERANLINRVVRLAFVERDPACRAKLRTSLTEHGIIADHIDDRPFATAAPDLLDRYAGHSTFAFLDPFGLGVDKDCLVDILRRSSRTQPIDVLYHFSVSSVARMGRAGISPAAAGAAKNAAQLDSALGDVGWRDTFSAIAVDDVTATRAAIAVARRFGDLVRSDTGVRWTAIEVRQRPTHQPKYLLMLFSADPSGKAHWDFADVAASAHTDWLHFCDTADFEANLRREQEQGLLSLFPPETPTREQIKETVDLQARDYLDRHLLEVFQQRDLVRPLDDFEMLYGQMLGRAGIPHLRAAIKRLHAAGVIADDGVGHFWERTITRSSTAR